MGTTGTGNFGRDAAIDYLFEDIVQPLIDRITTILGKNIIDIRDGEDILMPSIDVLATLGERYGGINFFEDLTIVGVWREKYLNAYVNANFQNYSKDFTVKRLQVITDTFKRLELACEGSGTAGLLSPE